MDRVSSGGAAAKMSPTPCGGLLGSANQVTNAVMPAWATRPTHERSSAGSARYQSRSSSSRRIAAADSSPAPSRTRRCVSGPPRASSTGVRRRAVDGRRGRLAVPGSGRSTGAEPVPRGVLDMGGA